MNSGECVKLASAAFSLRKISSQHVFGEVTDVLTFAADHRGPILFQVRKAIFFINTTTAKESQTHRDKKKGD